MQPLNVLQVFEEQWPSTSWSWHSTVYFMDHTLAHSPGPYKNKGEKRYIHTQQHLKAHTKSIDWWDKQWLMRVCERVDGSVPSPGYFLEKWQSALCPLSTLIINRCLKGTLSNEINETTSGQEQIRLPSSGGRSSAWGPSFSPGAPVLLLLGGRIRDEWVFMGNVLRTCSGLFLKCAVCRLKEKQIDNLMYILEYTLTISTIAYL